MLFISRYTLWEKFLMALFVNILLGSFYAVNKRTGVTRNWLTISFLANGQLYVAAVAKAGPQDGVAIARVSQSIWNIYEKGVMSYDPN